MHAESASDAESGDSDAKQLFVPYRAYCARKGVRRLVQINYGSW